MTNYEVMFIIDPILEDDKKEATVETVQQIINADGEVSKVGSEKARVSDSEEERRVLCCCRVQSEPVSAERVGQKTENLRQCNETYDHQ